MIKHLPKFQELSMAVGVSRLKELYDVVQQCLAPRLLRRHYVHSELC